MGIAKTMERVQEADLILLVMDSTQPTPVFPDSLNSLLSRERTIVVSNKSDLLRHKNFSASYDGYEHIDISALSGQGLEQLQTAIIARVETLSVPLGAEIIIINARHADALGRAQVCLKAAREILQAGEASELIASELRGALAALGEIAGKIDNDQVLDRLFSTFCIGK
jgi:tRNA modification GTPase